MSWFVALELLPLILATATITTTVLTIYDKANKPYRIIRR